MTTISDIIEKIKESTELKLELAYAHPLVYVFCISPKFSNVDGENRLSVLSGLLDLPLPELEKAASLSTVQLCAITRQEFEDDFKFLVANNEGQHWLEWFSRAATGDEKKIQMPSATSDEPRALHFYGLKGGQGRSTVLLLLAKSLADSGLKVLVVDADLEAPSLDAALEVAAEDPASTVLGIAGWADDFRPISRAYVGESSTGQVDLLACRPRSPSFDIDFASFLLAATLDARILQKAAEKLRVRAAGDGYQYVLIDHRTGLAPSVLPLMAGWPGAAVVFTRPDGMSRNLESAISALLGRDPQSPGAFVTFSLDPKDTVESVQRRQGRFVESLLERLSDAIVGADADIDPAELERYWMLWCHDPSLLAQPSPSPSQVLAKNRQTLSQLREVLGIALDSRPVPTLSKSGAGDEGVFILTPDFARLFSVDSGILYVLGRKGTGKTRLLKELHARELGAPLLVAQDYDKGGLQSGLPLFNSLLSAVHGDSERFWFALLRAGIRSVGSSLEDEVKRVVAMKNRELESYVDISSIEDEVALLPQTRLVFLIDGVETAVPASRIREFVEGLFRFMASVQFSQPISKKIAVRLFIRTDLHKAATQNIEQQIEGRSLDLRWDRQSILNFALARLASLSWFRGAFPVVCDDIDKMLPDISRGAVEEAKAEATLLQIFPEGLDRNKVKTTTFLATYFSDAGGESDAKASFYPRLFDGFLRKINERASEKSMDQVVLNNRLSSPLVLGCYDDASKDFLDEVRSELQNLLDLEKDQSRNQAAVNRLIDSFSGLKTPFVLDLIIKELAEKAEIPNEKVRESLIRMRRLGIFEDRPGYPGSWRTGRLYKSGLNMKYVRAKRE